MDSSLTIVKVGGSLYDLPGLGVRLEKWLRTRVGPAVVLVPGGGPTADVVRGFDRCHGLGEEKAHWLALRALGLNAWFLAALLPPGSARVVHGLDECRVCWRDGRFPVLAPHAFAEGDEGQPGCLPHCWAVTSDSLAARVAEVWGASRLILLKSAPVPGPPGGAAASAAGLVDPYFPEAARSLPRVEVLPFREENAGF